MRTHEFYAKYANTIMPDRMINLGKMSQGESITLNDIFDRVHRIDEKIRPDIIEKQKLIRIAEKFWWGDN